MGMVRVRLKSWVSGAVLFFAAGHTVCAEPGNFVDPPFSYIRHGVICAIGQNDIISGQDTIDGEVLSGTGTQMAFDVITGQVPAMRGISFGIQIAIPANVPAKVLTASVTHPPMGTERRTEQRWLIEIIPDSQIYVGYGIEDDFERVPGTWVFACGAGTRWCCTVPLRYSRNGPRPERSSFASAGRLPPDQT